MNEKVDDWQARFEYARLLKNLKKYDEALDQYDALLKEKPDSNLVKIEIAEVLFYQGKSNEALIELEKIPQNEMSEQSLLLMAENYQALKEYARAEKIYRDLLEKKPNDSPIKLKLAELLSWEKRYAESIELYEELLTAYPEDIQLRRKYAFVLMWMGNDKEAAEELKKTLK
jgi:tetratricopeptide (TPR) repeat protein